MLLGKRMNEGKEGPRGIDLSPGWEGPPQAGYVYVGQGPQRE